MANDARRLGTDFETEVVAYLRKRGLEAQRLARTGRLDQGDIFIDHGDGIVVECKARRAANSPANLRLWLDQAHREAGNYAKARGLEQIPTPILVVKNPNHSTGKAFVIQYLGDL